MTAQRHQAHHVLTLHHHVLMHPFKYREHGFTGGGRPDALGRRQRHAEASRMANALVIILEPRNGLFDQIANAIVVFHEVLPVHFAGRQGGLRQTGDNRRLRAQHRRGGLKLARRSMHHRHRILDGDRLPAAGLQVKLGAAQTRQNKGLFRRQEM